MAQNSAQIFQGAAIQELSDDRRFNNLAFLVALVAACDAELMDDFSPRRAIHVGAQPTDE
jgi:hypothetical protein